MKTKRTFLKRIFSPTPKKWKNVAKVCAGMAVTFTTAYGAVAALSLNMPEWFSVYIGWVIFALTLVAGFAQQHETEPIK